MKVLLLACLCAAAYAQNLESEFLSTLSPIEPYDAVTGPAYSSAGDALEHRGAAPALQDQYEQPSIPQPVTNKRCVEKNERHSVPGSCDKYIECLNGTAEEKQCPDGLRYNPNVKFNVDPCQYPIDVPCLGRAALQPAQPTDQCPHQFGYFRRGDANSCGSFKNCVRGVAYEFDCPEGLAFSPDTYRCEWPDLVSDCDVEAFVGFRCPDVPRFRDLVPTGYRFYRSPSNCQQYFICVDGKPRKLSCGGYTAFDDVSRTCVAADEVSVCPADIRDRAIKSRQAEEQRLKYLEHYAQLRSLPRELQEPKEAPVTQESYGGFEELTTVRP